MMQGPCVQSSCPYCSTQSAPAKSTIKEGLLTSQGCQKKLAEIVVKSLKKSPKLEKKS